MSKHEAFPFPHSPQAETNRKENLYPLLRRLGAATLVVLGGFGAIQGIKAANEHTLIGETTVTVHSGETAIGAINEGNDVIAEKLGYDPEDASGLVDAGRNIGSHVVNGQQIEVRVFKNGYGQKSIEATDITNIPKH